MLTEYFGEILFVCQLNIADAAPVVILRVSLSEPTPWLHRL